MALATRRAAPAALALLTCCGVLAACGSSASQRSGSQSHTSTSGASGGATIKISTTPKFGAPPSSEPVRSGTAQIEYRNITIRPDTVRVKAGTTVRWTNYDPFTEDVTSVSGPQVLRSGGLAPGRSFSVKLTRPGTIHYESTAHPATLNGTIEVLR